MSAFFLTSVSSIDEISLPSSSLLSIGHSCNGEHMTAVFGFFEDVVEGEPCVVSATKDGLGSISSSGVKKADGDSKLLEVWHLLFDENVMSGSSSESNMSAIAAAGDFCSMNRLSP